MPQLTAEMIGKKRGRKERVIIVLDGNKVLNEQNGASPLIKALRELVGEKDEVLVLSIVNMDRSRPSSSTGPRLSEGDTCIDFLHQEISRRKEAYKQILRPYYKSCKSKGVEFQVKIAVGCQPKELIMEEAKNMKATWIFMDSCFARDLSLRLNGTECNVSLVIDDESAGQKFLPPNNGSESLVTEKVNTNSKKPDIRYPMPIVEGEVPLLPPSLAERTSRESEIVREPQEENGDLKKVEPPKGAIPRDPITSRKPSETKVVLELPMLLSREVIAHIEDEFIESYDPNENCTTYSGLLPDRHSYVLVKKFKGVCNGVLVAEKKAATSMSHRNIQGLIGYHKREDSTFLVFPNAKRGKLGKYLLGYRGKQNALTFQDKMKIAIGIAQGIRYMHEECLRGPIVHGNLLPSNVLLGEDFQPLISGFEKSTWLHQEQAILTSKSRPRDPSDHESLNLVKADVLSFGVLLLRLFCHASVPQDNKLLIEWAQPLVLQHKFHELTGENTNDVDVLGVLRVMTAVIQCTRTKPVSRPCMSEVIALLKGEQFCCIESSPSDTSE